MNKTQHTPGPWRLGRSNIQSYDGMGTPIKRIYTPHDADEAKATGPNCEANARLIAAAPELLNALKRMLRAYPECDFQCKEVFQCRHEAAKEAIARATGGE